MTPTTAIPDTSSPSAELVRRYFNAVNNHLWDELAEIFHPDVTVQHGMSLSTSGRAKAVKLLAAVVSQFATHEDRPTRYIVSGDTVAVEIMFTGTLPDGTVLEFPAADLIDTDGKQITRVVSWYDTAVVLPQLKR
jgi:ketosteroid isomerase-like protein